MILLHDMKFANGRTGVPLSRRLMREPAGLFLSVAGALAVAGGIFFHSQWPPLTWRNVHFTADDYGQLLLFYAAAFAFIALVYFTLPRFPRLRMNRALGYVHFGICTAAVIAETFLQYWMSVTYKNVPGEGWFDALFRGFGAAMTSFIWALLSLWRPSLCSSSISRGAFSYEYARAQF